MEAQEDYVSSTIRTILQICLFEEPGDILVFLTGQEEIEEMQQILKEKLKQIDVHNAKKVGEEDQVMKISESEAKENSGHFVICPLFANLPPHQQMQAF